MKNSSGAFQPPNPDPNIVHYQLEILPIGQYLAFNKRLGILSLLSNGEHPLLCEAQFSKSELSTLLPLLEKLPYCPHEYMLASYTINKPKEKSEEKITEEKDKLQESKVEETEEETIKQPDGKTVEKFRLRLQEAAYAGTWDYEMRPLRNVLSRTRFKLRDFGIEVATIIEKGHSLIYLGSVIRRRDY